MSISIGLSVVIPVYNSESILPELINRLEKSLQNEAQEFEIILVNDGSLDKSWIQIRELARTHRRVRGIDLMRNYGQHSALLCGIRLARYNITVTIDDDLQNPPEEIPKLIKKLEEGYDVVYGAPKKERHGIWRDLASQMTKLALQGAMGAESARNASAFRAFRTCIREAFKNCNGPFLSIDVMLTWGTTRFAAIKVNHDLRRSGKSNYSFQKLIIHALNMITGFSTLPLQFASMIGFFFAFFGLLTLIYVIANYLLYGSGVPGFTFLALIITVFSGAILFSLGMIGEYIARIHFRMMQIPCYMIREEVHQN